MRSATRHHHPRRTAALLAALLMIGLVAPVPRSAAAVPVVDDQGTAFNLDAAHSGSTAGTTQAPPLTERWRRDLGDIVSYPLAVDGRVFVAVRGIHGGYGGTLHALDSQTGEDLWGPADVPGTYFWTGISAGDGRVYAVGGDGVLTAFDQATGAIDWVTDLPGQYSFSSEPTYYDGVVYVGGSGIGSTLYAVDAVTGDVSWSVPVGGASHSSPAVTEDAVYIGATCEDIRAVDRATGATIWQYPPSCSGGGGRSVAVADGKVWARQPFGSDLILDAATGELVGTFAADPMPAFHDGTAFFRAGTTLTARDTTTMAKRWEFVGDGLLSSAPMVVNGHVYIGSSGGKLFVLDEVTGALVWTADTPPIRPPDEHNVSEPVTALGAGEGLILAPATNTLVAFEHLQTRFVPVTPARLLDTRAGAQIGYSGPKPGAGAAVDLTVLSRGGVPTTGVKAVALRLTVTAPSTGGFATVWPTGAAPPPTSNLNMAQGQTIGNGVVVPVGLDGRVTIRSTAAAHLVADVTGYFEQAQSATAGRYVPMAPGRLLDTRFSGAGGTPAIRPAGSTLVLPVLGHAGVPEGGVTAVAVNITAVAPSAMGYLTAWRSGARPVASSLNYGPGNVISGTSLVPVGDDGALRLFTSARSHLVVDVMGWFTDATATSGTSGLYVPIAGARAVDTRAGTTPAAGSTTLVDVATLEAVPPDATAVVGNLTATGTQRGGYMTAFPAGTALPGTSNLNYWRAAQTIANLTQLALSPAGVAAIRTSARSHFVLDISGYYLP